MCTSSAACADCYIFVLRLCCLWARVWVQAKVQNTAAPLLFVAAAKLSYLCDCYNRNPKCVMNVSLQSAKSIRSSGGSAQLVNDQSVLQKGANASASVTITFQKDRECQDMEMDSDDDVRALSIMYFVMKLLVSSCADSVFGYSLRESSPVL